GGGIILDGRPLRGTGGYAGEIGHMSVGPLRQLCPCGPRGSRLTFPLPPPSPPGPPGARPSKMIPPPIPTSPET
ncbi:MAG: ROK family protein, partial [Frankiales bacterium]|nr:ROK family protein [Frankiales bacterium]